MKRIALLMLLVADGAGATDNGQPFFAGEDPVAVRKSKVDELLQETFRAVDPDGDPITVSAEGLPAGAKLRVRDARPWSEEDGPTAKETKARWREVVLTWTPTRPDRGHHPIALVVSDGKASERIERDLVVEEEWESFFLPGLQYVGYFPAAHARFGRFNGAAFELVVGSWVHATDARGPSHGRVYVDLALLDSDRAGADRAFAYTLGLDLSLERNPWRRWLIPVFGVEVGGFHQRETGSFFTATPFAGAHLFSTRNVFVTVTGGYVFSGRNIDELGGWRLRAGVNAVLW
jgi:hypothetical protein